MAYPHSILKITFGGRIYGNAEIWSNSIHIGNPTVPTDIGPFINSQAAKDAVVDAIRTWFTSTGSSISFMASLEWVKFAQVGADGKYTLGADGDYAFVETIDITPVTGSNGTNIAPQLTVAITLESGFKRGLAKTGRIYPPLTGQPNNAGKNTLSSGMATAAATLVSSLNAAFANLNPEGGTHDQVVIASKEREGAVRLVQSVRVGDVIDTQRRRRNAMTEEYTTADVTVYPESADETVDPLNP